MLQSCLVVFEATARFSGNEVENCDDQLNVYSQINPEKQAFGHSVLAQYDCDCSVHTESRCDGGTSLKAYAESN